MRTFIPHSRSLLLSVAAVALFPLSGALAQTTASHPIDPHPYPKPALMSDTITPADYVTVILSPPLQVALKVTDHQRAVFAAMKQRYDFNLNNLVGMGSSASMNVGRTQHFLDLTGNQVRDQLTLNQDKQLQDYFTQKILEPVTAESQTSVTPVYHPHIVYLPGFGEHYVQGSIIRYGSITVHYTKFSESTAATEPLSTGSIASEVIDIDDLPPLDPNAQKHRDELRQRVRDYAAQQTTNSPVPVPESVAPTPATPSIPSPAPPSTIAPRPALIAYARPLFQRPMRIAPLRVAPVIPPTAAPTPSTDKLADSFLQTLSQALTTNSAVTAQPVGGGFADQTAFDLPAKPGALVGFDLGIDDFLRSKTIQSITPIYLTAAGEVRGHFYGKICPTTVTIKAKDGYAIGGITARGNAGLDALSIQFMKRAATTLNPSDTYSSDVIGSDLTDHFEEQNGQGIPVLGATLKVGDNGFLGLALIFATSPQPK